MTDFDSSTTSNTFNTLDVGDWTPPTPPSSKIPERQSNATKLKLDIPRLIRALEATDSDDYTKWTNYGLALKYEGIKTGHENFFFGLWEWWSKQSSKSEGCDLEGTWQSFDPKGDITIGSILYREPKEGIDFQSLDDFMESDHEVTYLAKGVLVEGQPCIVGAPPKSFKTTLLLYLALCLAAGAEFLGRECKKCSVAFVSGESGLAAIQKAIRRQTASMELKPDRFFLTDTLPRFDQPLDDWEVALRKLDVDVLIVDPLYLCMDGSDAGNLFKMGHQLKNVADLAKQLGITLLLIHHFNKSASRENRPPQLSDLTQAGFSEFTRQWLLLSHRESYEPGHAKLYLNVGGSAGHSDLLHLDIQEDPWSVKAVSQAQLKREQDEQDFNDAVDIIRATVKEPMSKSAIKSVCKFTKTKWSKLFPRLIKDVILIETDTKSKGHPTYVAR